MFCTQPASKGCGCFCCYFSWKLTLLGLISTNAFKCFYSHFSKFTFGFPEGKAVKFHHWLCHARKVTACNSNASHLGGNRPCADPVLRMPCFKSMPTSARPQESSREAGVQPRRATHSKRAAGNSPGLFLGQDLSALSQ